MIVYHGTDSISAQNIKDHGIDLNYGDESVDNGQGFYMTKSRPFAEKRAVMATARQRGFQSDADVYPVVLEIELDIGAAEGLCIKEFPLCDEEWREFVAYNRLGKRFLNSKGISSTNHNLDKKYDIVIDETADAGVSDIISKIRRLSNPAQIKKLIHSIAKSDRTIWGGQVSLHSVCAVGQCVKSIKILDVNVAGA